MSLTISQEETLNDMLALREHPRLTTWEKEFLGALAAQYEEKGEETIVSSRMWVILQRIERKLDG